MTSHREAAADGVTTSAAMRRAALAELKRLARARAKVAARVDVLARQFAEAREELEGLDDRARILEALAGEATPDVEAVPAHEPRTNGALHGAAVREAAVRVLVKRTDPLPWPTVALHYRDWYRIVFEAGYRIAGKDPLAVFLTQITRSPVVRSSTSAGVYEVDFDGVKHAAQELEARKRQLCKLEAEISEHGIPTEDHRAKRRELTRFVDHGEGDLLEAMRVLSDVAGRRA